MRLLRLLLAAVAAFAITPLLLLWPRAHRALRPLVWRLARRPRAVPVVLVQPRAAETRNQRKRRRRAARA